jgi:hypothetical protein
MVLPLTAVPMLVDWNAVRDVYLARFGEPWECAAITSGDGPAPDDDDDFDRMMAAEAETARSFLLTFWNPQHDGSLTTYASFGTVQGCLGDEFFLTTVTPHQPFEMAVKDLAGSATRVLAPLTVVPYLVRLSAFDTMLVVPADDGPSTLGQIGGHVRRLLRLVPITRAERLLAVRDPERLLGLLRAGGALVADPLRACVVAPDQDGGRRANAGRLLEEARRSERLISENDKKMRAFGAPEVFLRAHEPALAKTRARLAFFEARVAAILPEPDAPELAGQEVRGARMSAVIREVMASSVDPYGGLVPHRVAEVLRVFMWALFSTHPVVYPIVYEAAMGEGRLPANSDPEGMLLAEQVEENVRSLLLKTIQTANARRLAAAGREAVKRETSALARRGSSSKVLAWNAIVVSLCTQAADLGSKQGPAAEGALRDACTVAVGADFEPRLISGPAGVRLVRVASSVSKEFLRAYLRTTRRVLQGRPAAS